MSRTFRLRLTLVAAVAWVVGLMALGSGTPQDSPAKTPVDLKGATPARVARVIDGDTIQLDGGDRVRLVGVDTPETVHPRKPIERFGKEASAFTKKQLEGEKVLLVFDRNN